MTEATLNGNSNFELCSIPSKFHMWTYDGMTDIYIKITEAYGLLVHGKPIITELFEGPSNSRCSHSFVNMIYIKMDFFPRISVMMA